MRLKKAQLIGMIFAVVAIILSVIFLRQEKIFYFALGISIVIGILPFFISLLIETEAEKEKDERFLEFSRNLVESVKAGTPISRSIINIKDKDYGILTPHVKKLANQISLGIPIKEALNIFARGIRSKTVSRSVALISEAEQAGGNIENILESVAKSVAEIEKLRKERRAAIYNLVVQGYIIFIIFIFIMLIMQYKIVPMTSGILAGTGAGGFEFEKIKTEAGATGVAGAAFDVSKIFIPLLLVQGFFAGLIIGKLAEGSLKAGIKHSFILMILAYIISTGARAFLS